MKIFIVGLGLIGSSYAEALHLKGYDVYGYDIINENVKRGIELGFLNQASELHMLPVCQLVILALYPKDNVEFIHQYRYLFKKGQQLTDVSGVKDFMMTQIEKIIPEGISYTSHHPMAGRELSGFENRKIDMFKKANFMIVKGEKSEPKDIEVLKQIANDLGFSKTIITDAKTHDALISFTSQLTHVLAVSLIQSDQFEQTKEATGDSFRDLTRIAKINEVMWSELFLENKEALIQTMNTFIREIQHVKELILLEDKDSLQKYLKEAKEKRKLFDANSNAKL
jgi:prephenate dehydrogenase